MDDIIWEDVPEGANLNRLAEEKLAAGQVDEAIAYQSRGVRLRRQLFGQRSPFLAIALGALARMIVKKSGLVAARPHVEEGLAIFETVRTASQGDVHLKPLLDEAWSAFETSVGPGLLKQCRDPRKEEPTVAPPAPAAPAPAAAPAALEAPAKSAGAMSRQELFELVAEEVFRDGVVEEHENEILNKLVSFLKLPPDVAKKICRAAQEKFKRGEMGPARPLDRAALYERILVSVFADGEVDGQEAQMVAGMRKLLSLTEELHLQLLAKVRAPRN